MCWSSMYMSSGDDRRCNELASAAAAAVDDDRRPDFCEKTNTLHNYQQSLQLGAAIYCAIISHVYYWRRAYVLVERSTQQQHNNTKSHADDKGTHSPHRITPFFAHRSRLCCELIPLVSEPPEIICVSTRARVLLFFVSVWEFTAPPKSIAIASDF